MTWFIVCSAAAIYLAMAVITFRLARYWMWQEFRERFPRLYDNSDYERRDAPHYNDWPAFVAVAWPIGLPTAAAVCKQTRWHKAARLRAEERWKARKPVSRSTNA